MKRIDALKPITCEGCKYAEWDPADDCDDLVYGSCLYEPAGLFSGVQHVVTYSIRRGRPVECDVRSEQ